MRRSPMAEEIRDIAEQDPEIIRQQIDETRSSLTAKLEALEEQVVGTVQNAKATVEETIENVKETVQETVSTVKDTFDIPLQVRRHPWPMVGGCFVLGLVTGAVVGDAQRRRRMPIERLASRGQPRMEPDRVPEYPGDGRAAEPRIPGLMDRFHEEIDQVKGLAIGLAIGLVRDVIKENVPQLGEQLGEVMDSITTKLGGQPARGPVVCQAAVSTGCCCGTGSSTGCSCLTKNACASSRKAPPTRQQSAMLKTGQSNA
jgi:ElaB/YqjD/DUF883 family membrane-anchored ribosome-binding protein